MQPSEWAVHLMSQEDQDAVVGRVIREHKASQQKLAALECEASRMARALSQVAQALRECPETVLAPEEGFRRELLRSEPFILGESFPTLAQIRSITRQIRECAVGIAELNRQRTSLGI